MNRFQLIRAILLLMLSGMQMALACDGLEVRPPVVVPGENVLLICRSTVEAHQVGVEIRGESQNISYPYLYDDGLHGDEIAGDYTYSLNISAPQDAGRYQVVFFKVLPDQTESESVAVVLDVVR